MRGPLATFLAVTGRECDQDLSSNTQVVHFFAVFIILIPGPDPLSCSDLEESEDCTEPACLDCQVSEWFEWGSCSYFCGGTPGTQSRSRMKIADAQAGGADCPELSETRSCTEFTPVQVIDALDIYPFVCNMKTNERFGVLPGNDAWLILEDASGDETGSITVQYHLRNSSAAVIAEGTLVSCFCALCRSPYFFFSRDSLR